MLLAVSSCPFKVIISSSVSKFHTFIVESALPETILLPSLHMIVLVTKPERPTKVKIFYPVLKFHTFILLSSLPETTFYPFLHIFIELE